ncbi:hypothetical protein STENM327S_07923 [Streptomyces tendae]
MTEQATGAHPQPRPRSGGQSAPEHVTGAQSLIRSLEEVGADTVLAASPVARSFRPTTR